MKTAIIHDKPLAWPTIVFFILIVAGYAFNYSLFISGHSSLVTTFFINVILGYLVFTPLHKASHSNIAGASSHKWMDQWIGEISGILLFAPFFMFKILHLRHHSNTNDEVNDPDYWVARKNSITLFLAALTIVPHYYYNAIFNPTSRIKEELPKTLLKDFFFILILGTICFVRKDLDMIILWPVSVVLSFTILAMTFDYLPHHPYQSKERYYDTRIFHFSLLSPLMLYQNYHLIHHLYPRIPWYRYAKAFYEIEFDLRKKNVTIVE